MSEFCTSFITAIKSHQNLPVTSSRAFVNEHASPPGQGHFLPRYLLQTAKPKGNRLNSLNLHLLAGVKPKNPKTKSNYGLKI